METEAWFIAESPLLTRDYINARIGIDIETINVESLDIPADILNDIYSLAGETYKKEMLRLPEL